MIPYSDYIWLLLIDLGEVEIWPEENISILPWEYCLRIWAEVERRYWFIEPWRTHPKKVNVDETWPLSLRLVVQPICPHLSPQLLRCWHCGVSLQRWDEPLLLFGTEPKVGRLIGRFEHSIHLESVGQPPILCCLLDDFPSMPNGGMLHLQFIKEMLLVEQTLQVASGAPRDWSHHGSDPWSHLWWDRPRSRIDQDSLLFLTSTWENSCWKTCFLNHQYGSIRGSGFLSLFLLLQSIQGLIWAFGVTLPAPSLEDQSRTTPIYRVSM